MPSTIELPPGVAIYNKHAEAKRNRPIPQDAVTVGRPSPWGNPYIVRNGTDAERRRVIEEFRAYALRRLQRDPDWLEPLRGKSLACWCHPKACHADVLLELLYGRK